jgi:hypothetical protein
LTENEAHVKLQFLFDELNEHFTAEQIDDFILNAFDEWLEENHPEMFEGNDE